MGASLTAILATLPEIWTVFGEFCPLGVVATPLALVPLVPLLLGGWGIALALPGADLTWVRPGAEALLGLLEAVDVLPGTPSPLPARPAVLLWMATVGPFVGGFRRLGPGAPRARRNVRRLTAVLWAVLLLPWSAAPAGLEVHVLDVGHGSCAVVRAPGLPALVYDAGSRDRRGLCSEALFPLLRRWDVGSPVIALSHDHADHRSGMGRLVERYPPRLWIGAVPAHLDERLPHSLRVVDPTSGRTRVVPGGVGGQLAIHVLRGLGVSGNEGSRSLELALGPHRVLLMGDAEEEGLARALAADVLPTRLRLLVFPHHGSETTHLGPLLRRTNPGEIWVSAATIPAVGREFDRRRLRWSWTGRDGPLALFLPSNEHGNGGGEPAAPRAPGHSPKPLRRPRSPSPAQPRRRDVRRRPPKSGNQPARPLYSVWRERDEPRRVDPPAPELRTPDPRHPLRRPGPGLVVPGGHGR